MKPGYTGIRRLAYATVYSIQGLVFAWRNESAFRQELMLALVMLPAALWLGETAAQVAVLAGSCFLVVIVELLNTAIEAVVDRVGPERNDLAGSAKDVGSAAVFVSLLLTAFVWIVVALERFG
ncbi:diacylglycerol kinase [Ectothiorhodospiraceae bacterium WFHF3C12]|nr:diacylglycerol kinase [Ectothiorhodospiraceae bacterium WFHF3C12]